MSRRMVAALIALALVAPAAAMDHSDHDGVLIHLSTVGGFQWAYHLIDNMAAVALMDDIPDSNLRRMKSHHLMVYLVDGNGKKVSEGRVGFQVTGPRGAVQRAMAMAMSHGFGADVDFKTTGTYTIQAKAVVGDAKLVDEFTYDVK